MHFDRCIQGSRLTFLGQSSLPGVLEGIGPILSSHLLDVPIEFSVSSFYGMLNLLKECDLVFTSSSDNFFVLSNTISNFF